MEAFIAHMERLFNEARVDELVEVFSERVPVYSEDGITLHATREDTEISIRRLIYAARAGGATDLAHRIRSVKPSRQGGTVAHVTWFYRDRDGTNVATGEVRYFCGPDPDGVFRVQMIDYVKSAFPDALSKMPRAKAVRGRPN